jgi:hypothetical protein
MRTRVIDIVDMKKVTILFLSALLLTMSVGIQEVQTKPNGKLTVRFEATGRYDIVAGGVGLHDDESGDILLNVPGAVIQAYLYWAGYDDTSPYIDDAVTFTVGVSTTPLTADWVYGPDLWFDDYYQTVYVEDVTSLILTGKHTYSISDFDLAHDYGAGLIVVYEDQSLPYSIVKIYDGLDSFHYAFSDPQGPNSEVTCADFNAVPYDRAMEITLFVGGVQHDDRPNAIWYQTGTDSKPSNLVGEASAKEIDGEEHPYPLGSYDGYEWDTFSFAISVPAGSEWTCVQIESVPKPGSGPPYNYGKGCSALFIASGFVLKLPPGTGTPGYWKNHPDAWPVDEITIGGVTYTKDEAINFMKTPGKGDKTYTMFGALVAAKLNVLIGNPSGCIDETITAADAWMAEYGPVGSGVEAKSEAWQMEGESLYEKLDDYNNGLLCAPSRD